MAFAHLNPLAALWQARGLPCLLLPGDAPEALSLCAEGSVRARSATGQQRAPQAARQTAPQAGPNSAQPHSPARLPASPARPGASHQTRPRAEVAPPVAPGDQAAPGKAWRPLPPHAWPAPWQERLSAARPGLVVWTYWHLGQDLCGTGDPRRRELLRRVLKDLNHPAGTHTFWPACLPASQVSGQAPAGDEPVFTAQADVFWSGVAALGARGVVVMGSAAARALDLPGGLQALQQLPFRGYRVWTLPDVDFLLREEQRYGGTLAFLRQALRQVTRR